MSEFKRPVLSIYKMASLLARKVIQTETPPFFTEFQEIGKDIAISQKVTENEC